MCSSRRSVLPGRNKMRDTAKVYRRILHDTKNVKREKKLY